MARWSSPRFTTSRRRKVAGAFFRDCEIGQKFSDYALQRAGQNLFDISADTTLKISRSV
jgi:hypothetical protein